MGTINAQRCGSGHGILWKLHSSVRRAHPFRDNFGLRGAILTQQRQQRAPSCVSFLQLHLESLKDYLNARL